MGRGGLCFTLFWVLSFFLITLSLLLFQAQSITDSGDVLVLKEFKNGIDPNSVVSGSCLSSWDFSVDPCDSLSGEKFTCGLRCDVVVSESSRVTELALDQVGYAGSLGSTSWNLPYLQTLDLNNNLFSGPIPDWFSNLTQLQRLTLSHNSVSGSIPDSLGSLPNLEELYLDNNHLEGPVPSGLNGLKNLKRLELQGNRLSGEFPELGQLGNLYFLDASNNSISGELPVTFPANLVELSLRNNQVEGNIPANIADVMYLQVMDLSNNKLSGSVPSGLFTHPSLEQVNLSNNRFDSVQVPGLSGLGSGLIALDLSHNQITGLLPGFMGLMPKLSALSLENNRFSGLIPMQYALKAVFPGNGLARFERLMLGGNYLFGPIPAPFLMVRDPEDSLTVRLVDNCLYQCPVSFFFCQGGHQKSLVECRRFSSVIP